MNNKLVDQVKSIAWEDQYGNTVPASNIGADYKTLCHYIDNGLLSPIFHILVLYPDETINYEINSKYIKSGGQYSENYQNGQRRSLSFTLSNEHNQFSPNIDMLWAGTKLKLVVEIHYALQYKSYFDKGIFVIKETSVSLNNNVKEVSISAADKFSIFEDATGRLEGALEIREGEDIQSLIQQILLLDNGTSYPFDPLPINYNQQFVGATTQVSISKGGGETYGSILLDLASQLSAEIFYDASGHLTLVPFNETLTDDIKPLLYNFSTDKNNISGLSFSHDYSQIINRVVVVGKTDNGSPIIAVASNQDPSSPLSVQRIGNRTGQTINDSNINSQQLAKERADFELRQTLILKSSSSAQIPFNPFLEVNTIITINDDYFHLQLTRFLLQSVSFALDSSNQMDITFSNLHNLPGLSD